MMIKVKNPKITLGKNKQEVIFLWICILTPMIQIINSIFLFGDGESNFGKVYRLITLVITMYYLIKYVKRLEMYFVGILILFSFFSQMINTGNNVGIIEGTLNVSKLISSYVFICSLTVMMKRQYISLNFFDRVFEFLQIFMPLSMIVPYILKIGVQRYEGTGYQGLYYENNALTIVFIIIYIYSIDELIRNKKISDLIKLILCLIALLMTGSKSSILYFIVISVIYLIRYFLLGSLKYFIIRMIIIVGIFTVIYLLAMYLFKNWILAKIEVYKYYYIGGVVVNGGSFLGFLTNGRSDMANYYLQKYYLPSNINLSNVIFGIQRIEIPRVEMDFFDILLYFGLPVIIILIVFNVYVIKRLKKCSFMIKIMYAAILVYGNLAGHIWNSSLSGLVMVLVYAIILGNQNNMKDFKQEKYYIVSKVRRKR